MKHQWKSTWVDAWPGCIIFKCRSRTILRA